MIEVGILKNFDSGTYKAGVQLAGSLTTYFDDISVAKNIPLSALVLGNYVILAIPQGNPRDACVIATWPQGSPGGDGGSKIQDADGDTSWDVEQSADEDKVHGKVKGVEAFLLEDDGILTLAKQSSVYVTADATAQTIPTTTETTIEFNTEVTDVQDEFNTATYTFTAKKAGKYFIAAKITWNFLPNGIYAYVAIKKGATYLASYWMCPGADSRISGIAFGVVALAANDQVKVVCMQYSGGDVDLMPDTNQQLYIHKLA